MLTLLVLIAVGAISGLVRGGSFTKLASTHFRLTTLLFIALVVQIGAEAWKPSWMTSDAALGVLIVTNLAVVVFLWANRALPGMWAAGAGLVLNVVVIAANGAMPVSPDALSSAGLERLVENPGLKHEILNDSTVLPWLGDWIPVPPLREILSLGDIVLAAGISWLVFSAMLPERRSAHVTE